MNVALSCPAEMVTLLGMRIERLVVVRLTETCCPRGTGLASTGWQKPHSGLSLQGSPLISPLERLGQDTIEISDEVENALT